MKMRQAFVYRIHYRIIEPTKYYEQEYSTFILAISYEDAMKLLNQIMAARIAMKHGKPTKTVLDIIQREELGQLSAISNEAKNILLFGGNK